MSEIYKEIMALRVGPIPQKCNASNHEIAHNTDCCLAKLTASWKQLEGLSTMANMAMEFSLFCLSVPRPKWITNRLKTKLSQSPNTAVHT